MADFNWDNFEAVDSGGDGSGKFDWNAYKAEEPVVSQTESALRGLAQGGSLGFADEVTGGAEALWEMAKGNPETFGKLYEKSRNESRNNYKAAEQANPITFGAGEFGGALGTAFIPGLNVAKGAGLAATAGKAALQGGLMGAGSTESSLLSSEGIKDSIKGAGMGAAGGALGYGVGQLFTPNVANALDDSAEKLAARALGAERGTIKKLGEDKVKQAGRYALDEGIISPFANTEEVMARNAAKQAEAGAGMQSVYSAIDDAGASTFNPLNAAAKVDAKVGDFWRSPINRGEANQLENTLESILMRGDQNIPLQEAQTLKQELGKVANWKNALNLTDKERMARDAYGVVSSAIDEATETGAKAIGKDDLASVLKQSKKLYSNSKTADELLQNKFAREQGNKMFGLTDNITGAAGLAGAVPTHGLSIPVSMAAVGAKKLGEKYGPQTAAIGADKLADVLRKIPQALGKYAPVLQRAAQRGTQALGAAHFILQQTDPEYQETIMDLDGQR